MRAGVQQILALEIDFRATQFFREPLGEIERRGAPAEFAEIIIQFPLKLGILLGAKIFFLQLLERMHQRLGHIAPAVRAKVAVGIWKSFGGSCAHPGIFMQSNGRRKTFSSPPLSEARQAFRATSMNFQILA